MKRCKEDIRLLTRSAEKIKADPTIPEDLKKPFLRVNQFLRAEIKRYDEAEETLRSPYHRPGDLLARARAKRQIQDTKAFVGVLKRIMKEHERKKVPITGNEAKERASQTGKDR